MRIDLADKRPAPRVIILDERDCAGECAAVTGQQPFGKPFVFCGNSHLSWIIAGAAAIRLNCP